MPKQVLGEKVLSSYEKITEKEITTFLTANAKLLSKNGKFGPSTQFTDKGKRVRINAKHIAILLKLATRADSPTEVNHFLRPVVASKAGDFLTENGILAKRDYRNSKGNVQELSTIDEDVISMFTSPMVELETLDIPDLTPEQQEAKEKRDESDMKRIDEAKELVKSNSEKQNRGEPITAEPLLTPRVEPEKNPFIDNPLIKRSPEQTTIDEDKTPVSTPVKNTVRFSNPIEIEPLNFGASVGEQSASEASRESQGRLAQINQTQQVSKQLVDEQTQKVLDRMGKPNYETTNLLGVGTEVMSSTPEQIKFDSTQDSGVVSGQFSGISTINDSKSDRSQLQQNVQAPIIPMEDPKLDPGVQIETDNNITVDNVPAEDTPQTGTGLEGMLSDLFEDIYSSRRNENETTDEILNRIDSIIEGRPEKEIPLIVSRISRYISETPEIPEEVHEKFKSKYPTILQPTDVPPRMNRGIQPKIPPTQRSFGRGRGGPGGGRGGPGGGSGGRGGRGGPGGDSTYDPIYPISLALYFGSATAPNWDPTIIESLVGVIGSQGITKGLTDLLWEQSSNIIDDYGADLFITKLSIPSNGSSEQIIKQYIEITQLFFSLRRNMAKGPRIPSASIPLGQLLNFSNLIDPNNQKPNAPNAANETATKSPDPLPTPPNDEEQRIRENITVSEETKTFLGGATPMEKRRYWRGEPRGSIAMTEQTDGLRRAAINRGVQTVSRGGINQPDDLTNTRISNMFVGSSKPKYDSAQLQDPNMPAFSSSESEKSVNTINF